MASKDLNILSSVLLAIMLISVSGTSYSAPSVSVSTKYYKISGSNVEQLKTQMKQHGPKSFWAYSDWYVRWNDSCQISVSIKYTYPRWTNRDNAPVALRRRWDRMMKNLRHHEKVHGKHGILAAREIEKARCRENSDGIIRKWAKLDKTYDRLTNHGEKLGVHF